MFILRLLLIQVRFIFCILFNGAFDMRKTIPLFFLMIR